MSDLHRNEATKRFTSLWSGDSNEWNHDQHMVAAGVHELLLKTTTITESDLRARIYELLTARPKAYSENASGKTPSSSRSVLNLVSDVAVKKPITDNP